MIRIYTHLDVWTCQKHNKMVLNRTSCDACVREQRAALHAQGICVTEDTRAPRPVRSYMKAPESKSKHIQSSASDAMSIAAAKLPCEARYKVNFKSNYLAQVYTALSSTTQALLMALDVTTDARILKMRLYYQAQIDSGATPPSDQDRLGYNLAIDMYHEIARVSKGRIEDPERVTGEFVAYFRLLYGNGQRLIVDEPASKPAKYVLNFTSLGDMSNLNITTQELLRKLDKYEGDVGKTRIYHEKLIAAVKSTDVRQRSVKIMAEDLWAVLPMEAHTRNLMKIRDQFLSSVEYLYFLGQRLTEVHPAQPEQPEQLVRKRSYADDVYDYLMTGTRELYHRQCLLETTLGAMRPQTRASLITLFRDFAHVACDYYIMQKMPNYNVLDTGHVYTLQTILADAYLEGKRR